MLVVRLLMLFNVVGTFVVILMFVSLVLVVIVVVAAAEYVKRSR